MLLSQRLMLNSWVLSSDFASSVPSTYNSSISSTSRLQEGKKWAVCYVARTCVGGDTYTENVTAGGIAVKSQTIGVVRKATSSFEQQNVNGREGILGLSFKKPVVGKNSPLCSLSSFRQTKLKSLIFRSTSIHFFFSIISNQLCLLLYLLQT